MFREQRTGTVSGRYLEAGVDIQGHDELIRAIKEMTRRVSGPEVLAGVGGFSGLFDLSSSGAGEVVLAAGADGVGTKVKIASLLKKHDTVGIDLVAMNVDDVVCCGARPLFFLDYIALGSLAPETVMSLISGIVKGCEMAGCALLGGETAQMPGLYPPGEYDLAGFAVGLVSRKDIIDGRRIVPGDVLIGLFSSGLHSNGFSLIRKVLLEQGGMSLEAPFADTGRTLGEELLEPTRIYCQAVLELKKHVDIKGIAHITGGGISGNLPRCLPEGVSARINRRSWEAPPIFRLLKRAGKIDDVEMFSVFNMGVGMILVLSEKDAPCATGTLASLGFEARVIGSIVPGRREVLYDPPL
jgi:phosphoribosylformylglycinamidine cyclo-ligase